MLGEETLPIVGVGCGKPHFHVDALNKIAKIRVQPGARLLQIDFYLLEDATGIASEDKDTVTHEYGFLNVMGHEDCAFDGELTFRPQLKEISAQGFGSQHVERREWLVHQKYVRMNNQPARKADTLAHTARQFARIGGFKARGLPGRRIRRRWLGTQKRRSTKSC